MGMASSVRWVGISQAVRVATQLLSVTILARVLPTSTYGLMAMAMTVTNLVFLFRDVGSSVALIQRKVLSPSLVVTAQWLNISLGFLSACLLCLLAFPLSLLFKEPQLFPVIFILAFLFPVSSFSLVSQALLERCSQFRVIALIEMASSVAGLLVAVIFAYSKAGVWSLVFQMLFSTCMSTVLLVLFSPAIPLGKATLKELRTLFSFGGNFSLFRCVLYFEQNMDSFIIGKYLGSHSLGVYSMACKIMLFPLQNLTAVFSRAIFPRLCEQQQSLSMVKDLYLRSLSIIFIVSAPLMAGAFMLRESFVLILFGPQWVEVASIFQWLAPVGLIQSLTASTGVIFLSMGRTRLLLKLGCVGALLQVAGFVLGLKWGLIGVAVGFTVANLLNFFPCFYYILALLKLQISTIFGVLVRPAIAVVLMVSCLQFLDMAALFAPYSMGMRFCMNIFVGAFVYVFSLLVFLRQDISDFRMLLKPS